MPKDLEGQIADQEESAAAVRSVIDARRQERVQLERLLANCNAAIIDAEGELAKVSVQIEHLQAQRLNQNAGDEAPIPPSTPTSPLDPPKPSRRSARKDDL